MAGDLGRAGPQVHAAAKRVLSFWFDVVPPEKRFAKDARLDALIAERFGDLRTEVLASDADGWSDDPRALLAAVILLDQFSRNIHRGTAAAYAGDALALRLARQAIAAGWDAAMRPDERQFLYMPLMHSEDTADQHESVRLFGALGEAEPLRYAREHADVTARFGRFPSRNAALGRDDTPEETAYLSRPGAGW